ncbi:cation transporter [Diaphorobacter sp. HDW4A]|uniref:cation diffusion facilitator family transporter n=1 Tax=Diaphorobacter sp. HDW4A TaxID=2714924 RepID=UPI00140B5B90|nr:cation diffusion facilitator family transporter [Diaphorobacter sp. HDW4A]QIL81953.1 cation transporter [Diaphorobacter sp. HDW4A]
MPNAPLQSTSPSASVPAWMTPSTLLRVSVAVAVLTIALKTLAWWVTGSVGMLSDALESFVNLAGAVFALAMVTIARRPADEDHPYGHHKAEFFSSGFEGILIIGAAIAIVWASVSRLLQPQPVEQVGWGSVLLVASSVCNGVLAWYMLRAARVHHSKALEGDARHLFTDVWTSAGVLVGLIAAGLTGWHWIDPVVAILVALNILREGGAMLWESSQGLMDEALPQDQLHSVQQVLERYSEQSGGEARFDSLISRRAGSRNFVDVHMHVPSDWKLGRAAQLRTDVEAALMQAVPNLRATIEILPLGQATVFETVASQGE